MLTGTGNRGLAMGLALGPKFFNELFQHVRCGPGAICRWTSAIFYHCLPCRCNAGQGFPRLRQNAGKKKRPAGLFLVFCFWLLAIDCCYYFFWLVFVVVISFLFLLLITKHAPCQFCQPVEK